MINEPSFVYNSQNGGMNWGYCLEEKIAPPIKYYAIIETSNIIESGSK